MHKLLLILSLLCLGAVQARAQEVYPFVARISAQNANIRAGQNINFESLGQIKHGETLVVVGESFDWRKVKLPVDAKVYVSAGFVKDLGHSIGEVTGNRLNIRAAALPTASIVGQLRKGENVRILEKVNDWYRIEPPDQSFGWVSKDLVEFMKTSIPAPRQAPSLQAQLDEEKQQQEAKLAEEKARNFSVTGIIEESGPKAVSEDIRHFIKNGNTVYALQGYRGILDGFLHQTVKIEGKLQPDIKSDNPVVLVTKVSFVL